MSRRVLFTNGNIHLNILPPSKHVNLFISIDGKDACFIDNNNTIVRTFKYLTSNTGSNLPSSVIDWDSYNPIFNKNELFHKEVYFKWSSHKGISVFAKEIIHVDEGLIEYIGENSVRSSLSQTVLSRAMTIEENLGNQYIIDCDLYGNAAQFINHSENPNVTAYVVNTSTGMRIGIWASKPINIGDEILLNYGIHSETIINT